MIILLEYNQKESSYSFTVITTIIPNKPAKRFNRQAMIRFYLLNKFRSMAYRNVYQKSLYVYKEKYSF
jgi:hypothetical protein